MANSFPNYEQVVQQMQAQEAELVALRAAVAAAQIAAAQATAAAAESAATAANNSTSRAQSVPDAIPLTPFGREPKPFAGQREHLESFLDHLRLIFALQPQSFPTDKQKVLFTASYLEGPAFSWFQPLLTKDDEELLSDFAKFTNGLIHTFGDTYLMENAEDRLHDLKQLTSVAHYSSEFRRLAAHTRINEEGLTPSEP